MISKGEVKKLADLARIKISDEEAEKLGAEIDTILDYVSQISHIVSQDQVLLSNENQIKNVMREDSDPTESGFYSKELMKEFPEKEGDYLKVKKVL